MKNEVILATVLYNRVTVKTMLATTVSIQSPQLIQVASLWKPHGTIAIKLRNYRLCTRKFGGQKQMAQLESRDITSQ
jgi:hypothetical protein